MQKAQATLTPKPPLKSPTGIQGLEITGGGLPAGRPTLICGGAGCGKTLLALEFLVRGATQSNEPVVFMAFDGVISSLDSAASVASLQGSGRPDQLTMIAHTIKRSCMTFGARPMEALCLELEQRHRLPTARGAREILNAIEWEFFNVRTALTNAAA